MPPWLNNLIPEWMKKSVCSCLIKRYLSQFIENEITRDQLNLDLYNGRATAERISLAVESLNELGDSLNWPIEFVDGYIDKIHISVPWTNIFNDSTLVEICGLKITVQPKQRKEDATSMFESMWNSMTSSMHLAEEYVKEEAKDTSAPVFEGIERFAQTIESIVRRIKVTFKDTAIQIEHLPKESKKGVGLLINIDLMKYFDEYSTEDPSNQDTLDPSKEDSKKAYLIDSFTTKDIFLEGVRISSIEFPSVERTYSRSLIRDDSRDSSKEEAMFAATDNEEIEQIEEHTENIEINYDDDLDPDRHVILFGQFYNKQEVRIRLKQSENINGPKVAIEVNLGSLILFLSPRQFHILIELIEGFSSPDLEDNSNVPHKNQYQPRPMTEKDYERVEEQLGNLLNPMMNYQGLNLQQTHGWSTGALDESTDSQYLPMREVASGMYDSTMSGISSSMDSSMTSSMVSSVTDNTAHTRRRACNIDIDPTAEISRFQVRLANLAAVLLHEDLLTQATDHEKVLVKQVQNMAEEFFENVSYNSFSAFNTNGFELVHKSLDRACRLNHLRLIASPFQLEADEKTTSNAFSISGHMTAAKLELTEYLNTGGNLSYIPLINFNSTDSDTPSSIKPNVRLKFKHIQRTGRSNSKRNGPKSDLVIYLDKCSAEFDLSIIDRITSLLHHPPICSPVSNEPNLWSPNYGNQTNPTSTSTVESIVDLKVTCPSLNFKVRFPIPDFRPPTDMSKVPWWERNVRQDYIALVLQETAFHTVFQTNQSFNEYSIECKLLDIYYYETENSPGLHIGRSGRDDQCFSSIRDKPLTKLSIKVYPQKFPSEDDIEPDPMTHSFYGAFENQGNPEPGPFGSKRVVHESDTPHNKQRKDDSEELVIPGDKSEIKEFVESTSSNAQILVELILPLVSVQIHSKHIYELVYNRINNDLLLWKPGAPKPSTNNIYKTGYGQFNDLAFEDKFIMAKSGVQIDSDSDDLSDDDVTAGGSVFYSTYESKYKQSLKSTVGPRRKNGQSDFVMSLQVGEGILTLNPPVRDTASNVIPGQQGEFLLNINNAEVFIVSGYKGDEDLGYVCVQVNNAQLYHCDIQPIHSTNAPLREVGSTPGKYLNPTIYQSDARMLATSSSRGGDREMFSVAVKIQANHETHHVKVITVSLGLNKATLKHNMIREPNSWISHIIDFFNVQDYPIPGYVPKDVLTELHLHLWDCAVDYRPLHIPIRSIITIGNFSLSSHLTAVAHTSTLRFIFEECGLFLSEKAPPRNGVASNARVDLSKDYVNVMELGLFEISIKTTDKKSGINPHIDLRASNNMLHIRTCSDSGRALLQLLTYYISDGDLNPEAQTTENSNTSPKESVDEEEEELVSVGEQEHSLSKSQQDQVSELLEEAMEESPESNKTGPCYAQTGAKLFYFPDEKEALENLPTTNLPQVAADLGDINAYHFGKNSDTDDEFCIVGNDSGLLPKDGIPEISWLTEEPIKIIENHINVPVGKKDILEPPKDFPTPVMRYTLCEMSVVWQMYGGNDFKAHEPDPKKQVRFSEMQLGDKVSFSNTNSRVTFNQSDDSRAAGLSWIQRGGVNRDHDVLMELQLNKVRFRHDVYPETTKQASRQVLSISDVEIRDRLSSSQINKFLYQYSSQSRPKKSHSHMVYIKALHIRPDPKLKTQECMLKISILPIRLNIDQDSLLFMINFFKELSGDTAVAKPEMEKESSLHSTPTHQPPIMTVSLDNEEEMKQQAKQVVNENLILLESRYHADPEEGIDTDSSNASDDSPIYFRYVEFSRDVLIRLDYQGKRVDMSHGPVAGLLMGLGQLNCSEIRLKRIVHRHGLLGFSKLFAYLLQEWLSDIKKNQLSNILGGVGPMHAVLQLFQGVKDLFWLPIEQYQKDGRIVRGLQRGANSFTTSTAMAALELTTRIIYFIQITAETAYDMLSPGPSIRMKKLAKHKGRRKRYHQPQDIREGFTNACMVVREGIGETADNIVQVATLEKEQKGISGAVGAVIRQIPPTILKPILIASEATTNVLGGMQSQLVPDARKEANQKWRNDS